jgi:hypothetical protein
MRKSTTYRVASSKAEIVGLVTRPLKIGAELDASVQKWTGAPLNPGELTVDQHNEVP